MYLRSGAVPSGADQRFYDLGNFQIMTQGMQAAATIGELWVTYHVKFLKPKLPTPLAANVLYAHIVEGPAASAAASGSAFLGTTGGILRSGSTIPVVSTKSTFSMPYIGRYIVSASWNGSVTVVPTFAVGANLALGGAQAFFGDNSQASVSTVSSGQTNLLCWVDVTSPGTAAANLVTISGLTSLAAGTADIVICQVSSGFLITKKTVDERLAELEKLFLSSSISRKEIISTDSECESPHDYKEAELERSVHIPRSQASAILSSLLRH